MISGILIVFVVQLTNILLFLLFARAIISFFPQAQYHRIAYLLHDVTEPILRIARMIPHRFGMMDLSLLIAFFGLQLLSKILVFLLMGMPF